MSSSIFFRFKSRKDALQINFDGASLSVFEVKREIMSIARLGDGKEFDLDIYTSDSNESKFIECDFLTTSRNLTYSIVYDDDTTEIPRSTTVIVRRQPAQRPGAGRAARYVTGQMPIHAKNARRIEPSARANGVTMNGGPGDGKAMTEEERLQAVMSASNIQLKADLEMSAGKPVMRNNFAKAAPVPDKPLPSSYVCHRCGEKGHWIQACPTNTDPNYDGKHKFKRTTGIPRSMLEVVEKPEGVGEDGKIDPSKLDKGLMYTADGEWVRARPDQAAWQKFQDQQNATNEKKKEAAQGDEELRERGLECPIDKRPFADPVKTPCCGRTYCRNCIENAVLDADLTCPNCGEQVLLDNLEIDSEAVTKLAEFEAEKKNEKNVPKEEEAAKSPVATVAAELSTPQKIGSPTPATSRSPAASLTNSRKRGASEELENTRKPIPPTENDNPSATSTTTPAPSVVAPPTGPSQPATKVQPPTAPKSMNEFVNQMNNMTGGNGTPNPNAQNPMANFMNPMMAGMGMGMPMNMQMGMGGMGMGMGMPGFPMMNGFPGMNMGGYPNGMGMNMNGGGGGGNMGWQQQQQNFQQQQGFHQQQGYQQQQPWMNNNGANGNGANDGAYFRQPVNPHRHQGKQRRQRSVDYKQM
jgi:protein MPE1